MLSEDYERHKRTFFDYSGAADWGGDDVRSQGGLLESFGDKPGKQTTW